MFFTISFRPFSDEKKEFLKELQIKKDYLDILAEENSGYWFFNGKCTPNEALYDFVICLYKERFQERYYSNPIPLEDFFFIFNLKVKFDKEKKAESAADILFQGKNQAHIYPICALYYDVFRNEVEFEVKDHRKPLPIQHGDDEMLTFILKNDEPDVYDDESISDEEKYDMVRIKKMQEEEIEENSSEDNNVFEEYEESDNSF
jgi:hypothetical protein